MAAGHERNDALTVNTRNKDEIRVRGAITLYAYVVWSVEQHLREEVDQRSRTKCEKRKFRFPNFALRQSISLAYAFGKMVVQGLAMMSGKLFDSASS